MAVSLFLLRSVISLGALLALGATAACNHHDANSVDVNAVLTQAALQNRVCIDEYVVAQTPARVDPQGVRHPSTFLFSALLRNRRREAAAGPFFLRMTVSGGGHEVSSPPPHVELPATSSIRAGGVLRSPVLVSIPAVDGQPYAVEIRLWESVGPEGGDGSVCQRRGFTVPAGGPMPSLEE